MRFYIKIVYQETISIEPSKLQVYATLSQKYPLSLALIHTSSVVFLYFQDI